MNTLVGRPPKPEHLRRSKMFPLLLTPGEFNQLHAEARRLGVSLAKLFREGAALYIETRGKGGHRQRKERKTR